MPRRRSRPHYILNLALILVVLGVFAVTGVRVVNTTLAATSNPYGQADYCALENNTTVIYGWATDPDANALSVPSVSISAGGLTVTAPTNRSDYREAAINTWIDTNRKGDPKAGTYGFRAVITGLYKGARHTITGSVLNEGPGLNTILSINNASPVDGDSRKPFFADNLIPEACLGVQTAATPAVTPLPRVSVSDPAGASITTGTLAAEIKVPANGASTIRVNYGKNPLKLDQFSSDHPVTGAESVVLLTGLEPASSYAFQVARTDARGKTTSSPTSSFNTLGYVVAVHFVDARSKGIQGIPVTLDTQDKRKTSNEDGDVQFTDIPKGMHTISYRYLGKSYSRKIAADASQISPAEAAAPRVVTIDTTTNLEAPVGTPASQPASDINWAAIILSGFLGLLVLYFIGFFLTRKRRQRRAEYAVSTPPPPLPEYNAPVASAPQLVVPHPQGADHMGESLKDMVIKGIQDESRKDPRL